MQRTAAATLSNFTLVPELLHESNLIGVFTQRTAENVARNHALAIQTLPMGIDALSDDLIWHKRFNSCKRHIWLREQLLAACV